MNSGTIDLLTFVAIALEESENNNSALYTTLVRPVLTRSVRESMPALLEQLKVKRSADETKKFRISFCEAHNIGYQQLHDAQQNYRKWVRRQSKAQDEAGQDDQEEPSQKEGQEPK